MKADPRVQEFYKALACERPPLNLGDDTSAFLNVDDFFPHPVELRDRHLSQSSATLAAENGWTSDALRYEAAKYIDDKDFIFGRLPLGQSSPFSPTFTTATPIESSQNPFQSAVSFSSSNFAAYANRIETAVVELMEFIQSLPQHEAQMYDTESLINHTATIIRQQYRQPKNKQNSTYSSLGAS